MQNAEEKKKGQKIKTGKDDKRLECLVRLGYFEQVVWKQKPMTTDLRLELVYIPSGEGWLRLFRRDSLYAFD